MKKLYYLIVLALILGLVLTGCLLSNVGQVPTSEQSGIAYLTKATEGAPLMTTLFAGQHIDVGTVSVWNDDENLYVTYNTTGGWVLTETHLHVATSLSGIPQTKKRNPIPGKFKHSAEHDPAVTEHTYTISITWKPCTELYVAAHAKVIRPVDDCWDPVWQIGDVEPNPTAIPSTALSDEFGGKNPDGSLYALGDTVDYLIPPNDFRWDYDDDMAAFPFAFAPPGWEHGTYGDVFTETVNIHYSEYMPFGGKLTWRWTAGRSAPETYGVSHDASLLQTYVDQGISTPEGFYEHSLTIPAASGNQMITFDHKPPGDGGRWDWIRLEKQCLQEETAWADGPGFIGKNWATYFKYTVDESYMVGTWSVDWVFLGTVYDRLIIIDTQVGGAIDGVFWVINHPTLGNKKTGTIKGTIDCDGSVYMFYKRTDIVTDYTAELWGTVHADGKSVYDGTWKDSKNQVGTWTAYLQ